MALLLRLEQHGHGTGRRDPRPSQDFAAELPPTVVPLTSPAGPSWRTMRLRPPQRLPRKNRDARDEDSAERRRGLWV
jgi:hypothetical protein